MTVHKIKLHTYQAPSVLEAINKTGVYYAQTDVMMDKYKNCVDMYQPVYDWLIRASCRRVRKPEKVDFPVWIQTGPTYKSGPFKGQVLLELEINPKDLIILDTQKWHYILNYWYIPENAEDGQRYDQSLKDQGIHNPTKMYMSHFYPILKRQVEDSWERLFVTHTDITSYHQIFTWQLKKEWIVATSIIE